MEKISFNNVVQSLVTVMSLVVFYFNFKAATEKDIAVINTKLDGIKTDIAKLEKSVKDNHTDNLISQHDFNRRIAKLEILCYKPDNVRYGVR